MGSEVTLIDSADSAFKDFGDKKSKPFRDSYEYLSEYCHPNMGGLTIGSEILDKGIIEFYKIPYFDENDYGVLLNDSIMTIEYFFYLYDKCFDLIKKNEDIPSFEK